MPGIVPRMNKEIFERLAQLEGKVEYKVRFPSFTLSNLAGTHATLGICFFSRDLQ